VDSPEATGLLVAPVVAVGVPQGPPEAIRVAIQPSLAEAVVVAVVCKAPSAPPVASAIPRMHLGGTAGMALAGHANPAVRPRRIQDQAD